MQREATGQTTPFDLVLTQMSSLTQEVKEQGKLIAGVLVSVKNLSEKSDKLEKTMQDVVNAEWSCPARQHDDQTQTRISKIEALNHLQQTGDISVVTKMPDGSEAQINSAILKMLARNWTKILPWIIATLLGLASAAQQGWIPGTAQPSQVEKVNE